MTRWGWTQEIHFQSELDFVLYLHLPECLVPSLLEEVENEPHMPKSEASRHYKFWQVIPLMAKNPAPVSPRLVGLSWFIPLFFEGCIHHPNGGSLGYLNHQQVPKKIEDLILASMVGPVLWPEDFWKKTGFCQKSSSMFQSSKIETQATYIFTYYILLVYCKYTSFIGISAIICCRLKINTLNGILVANFNSNYQIWKNKDINKNNTRCPTTSFLLIGPDKWVMTLEGEQMRWRLCGDLPWNKKCQTLLNMWNPLTWLYIDW